MTLKDYVLCGFRVNAVGDSALLREPKRTEQWNCGGCVCKGAASTQVMPQGLSQDKAAWFLACSDGRLPARVIRLDLYVAHSTGMDGGGQPMHAV
jgi:hypothetical protein|mmetsp:Transcript_104376/g.176443  ORF Transcript_104376/g.176443 Transcript_104376/m.176443 type:complete len:95 (+) Transcript_104376:1348-1632(+)